MAAWCYSQRRISGWVIDPAKENSEAERLARRACEIGRDDAVALVHAGVTLANVAGDLEGGKSLIDRAVMLNPNLAWGWFYSGWFGRSSATRKRPLSILIRRYG